MSGLSSAAASPLVSMAARSAATLISSACGGSTISSQKAWHFMICYGCLIIEIWKSARQTSWCKMMQEWTMLDAGCSVSQHSLLKLQEIRTCSPAAFKQIPPWSNYLWDFPSMNPWPQACRLVGTTTTGHRSFGLVRWRSTQLLRMPPTNIFVFSKLCKVD